MSEEEDKRPTRGLFDFSDGGHYQGEWFCGGAHGYGVCSLPGDGGSSFEGYWEEGSQKSGVFTWSSGHKYIGTWQDGMRHGLGKELRPDGTEYLGDFSSNVRGPNGILKLSNGALYQGTWSDGLQDGIGVEIYADKGVYKGQYKKGQRNGYGTRSSSNYEVYSKLMQPRESQTTDIIASSVAPSSSPTISHSSSFRVSKGSNPTQLQTGPSVSSLKYVAEPTTDSDTQIYEGQWEKDKREGHGILKIPGRYSYLGQWKNNGRSGYGVVLHENGRKDEGLWEEGKLVLPLKRKRLSYKHHQLETKVKAAHTAALQAADVARTKSILAESRSLGVVKRSNAASVSAQKAEEDAAKAREVSQSLSGDSGTKATGKLHSSFPTPTDFNLSNRDTCISTPADSLLSVPVLSSASSFEDMASLQDHDENLKPNLSSSSCSGSDIEGEEKASMFDCDTVSVQSDPCGGISIKVSEEEEEEFKPVRDLSSRSKRASVPSSARSRHSISSYDANKSKSKSFYKQHRLLEEDEGEEREGEEAQMETVRRRLSHMNAPRVDQSTEDNEKELKEREPVKDIGIQFDYIVPSMDNLECMSDVNIASKKLFLIQGDGPQLLNWERYGLRIGVSGGSLSSTETAEVAVVALVGGEFVFPKKTVLVSAVYAVSVSRPLLKALRLEIQHCVDLSRGVKTKYLKFAIAPMSTASLPYKFSIVDGGEFSEGNWYGSINREKFCLVSIVGSLTNGGGGNGGEHNGGNKNGGGDDEEEKGGEGEEQGAGNIEEEEEEGKEDGHQQHDKREQQPKQEERIETKGHQPQEDVNEKALTTGVSESMAYSGIMYYEVKGVHDLVTFTTAKRLNALIEYIEGRHANAELGQHIDYEFGDSSDCIELILDHTPQKYPFTGWTIQSRIEPCRLYKKSIDKFGALDAECPIPPKCIISVYGCPSSTTVPMLYYAVPLKGVLHPVTLFIDRSSRNIPPTPHPSPIVPSVVAAPSTERLKAEGTDIKSITDSLIAVLRNKEVVLSKIFEDSLPDIALGLSAANIITHSVRKNPSYDSIIRNFITGLEMKSSIAELEAHSMDFLEALSNIGGPVTGAADMLRRKWREETSLQLDNKRIKLS